MSKDEKPEEIVVPSSIAQWYEDWTEARQARLRWEAREDWLKGKILGFLYDEDDPKPHSVRAVTPNDQAVFDVAVSPRRGLDHKYFRATYPNIYAECEKSSFVKVIKEPPSEPEGP